MSINREQLYAALAAQVLALTSGAGIRSVQRQVKSIDDIAPADKPCVIQVEDVEDVKQRGKGLPPIYLLQPALYVYMEGSDPNVINATLLNPVLDALCNAFQPTTGDISPGGANTLGGLCSHCWVSGRIVISDGSQGGGILAIVPIEILAA